MDGPGHRRRHRRARPGRQRHRRSSGHPVRRSDPGVRRGAPLRDRPGEPHDVHNDQPHRQRRGHGPVRGHACHGVPGQILTDFRDELRQRPDTDAAASWRCLRLDRSQRHRAPLVPSPARRPRRAPSGEVHRAATEFRTDRVFVRPRHRAGRARPVGPRLRPRSPHQHSTCHPGPVPARPAPVDPIRPITTVGTTCRGPPPTAPGSRVVPAADRRGMCQLATVTGVTAAGSHRRVGHRQGPAVLRRRPAAARTQKRESPRSYESAIYAPDGDLQ